MEKYELYYKNTLIGILEINDTSCSYKSKNKETGFLEFLKEDMDYLHPFFSSRINNMSKFNMTQVQYPTDGYKLVKVIVK